MQIKKKTTKKNKKRLHAYQLLHPHLLPVRRGEENIKKCLMQNAKGGFSAAACSSESNWASTFFFQRYVEAFTD